MPTAMFHPSGRLVTEPGELKTLYLSQLTQRLRNRPIQPGYEELKNLKEELCSLRLQYLEKLPYDDWNMDQLDIVLSKLKKGKSADPYGLIGELFRVENIGLPF